MSKLEKIIERQVERMKIDEAMELGRKQGRADVIEHIKAIVQESEKMMWCADKTLEKIKEQLKEQKNE